jgi:hypothetical protein
LWAKDDASKGQYLIAADKLKKVSNYQDSFELISSYEYEHALVLENSKSYEDAVVYLHNLKGYKDAEKRLYYDLYQIIKKRFVDQGILKGVTKENQFEYSVKNVWDGLRLHGYELSVTHDDVFWDIVFVGRYQNSSGYFLRRYAYKDAMWISYNLSAPSFDFYLIEDNTIMACSGGMDACKPWLSIQFTSEKAISVYNWHDKKTIKLSK